MLHDYLEDWNLEAFSFLDFGNLYVGENFDCLAQVDYTVVFKLEDILYYLNEKSSVDDIEGYQFPRTLPRKTESLCITKKGNCFVAWDGGIDNPPVPPKKIQYTQNCLN